MSFLSNLFRRGEPPDGSWRDEVLGQMAYSEDDEAWFGEFQGRQFCLAYDGGRKATPELIAYAREVLRDGDWLARTLAAAKVEAREERHDPRLTEIEQLAFGVIHFYIHKGTRRIIADLDGGLEDRCWRIEYRERECEGMGFDR